MKTVKALNIPNYGTPFKATLPKKVQYLGVTAQIDPNNANVKPRLVYLQDSQFPQTQEYTYILLRGQADLDHPDLKKWDFVGLTYDQNRRHNGIATLWSAQPVIPTPIPKDPNPKPQRIPTPHSPESLAAIAAHKEKMRLEEERMKIAEVLEVPLQDEEPVDHAKIDEFFKSPPEDLELKPLTSEAPNAED